MNAPRPEVQITPEHWDDAFMPREVADRISSEELAIFDAHQDTVISEVIWAIRTYDRPQEISGYALGERVIREVINISDSTTRINAIHAAIQRITGQVLRWEVPNEYNELQIIPARHTATEANERASSVLESTAATSENMSDSSGMTSADRENAMQTAYSAIRTEEDPEVRVNAVDTMIWYALAEYFLNATNGNEKESEALTFAFIDREDVGALIRDLKTTALKTPEKIDSVMTTAFQTLSVLLKTAGEPEVIPPEDTLRQQIHAALGSPEEFFQEFSADEVDMHGRLVDFLENNKDKVADLCNVRNSSVTKLLDSLGYRDSAGKPLRFDSKEITAEKLYLTYQRHGSPEGYHAAIVEAAKDYICAHWFDEKDLTWAHVTMH